MFCITCAHRGVNHSKYSVQLYEKWRKKTKKLKDRKKSKIWGKNQKIEKKREKIEQLKKFD